MAWFFLTPFRMLAQTPLKQWIMDVVLALYRVWRFVKKSLIITTQGAHERIQQTFASVPVFAILLTVLIVSYSVHNTVRAQELGSGSLLSQLFEQSEELTVVEAVPLEDMSVTSSYLVSALESPVVSAIGGDTASSDIVTSVLPQGFSGALVTQVQPTSPQPRNTIITHRVEPGDTISTIAEEYGITTNTVLWANHLSKYSIIKPGEDITILPASGVVHKVKSGDTLLSIAAKYDVAVEDVASTNDLVSANQLSINQNLIIPGGAPIKAAPKPSSAPKLASVNTILTATPKSYSGSGEWLWPTPQCHRVTQYYWLRHKAVDVGCKSTNHDIIASKAGRVEFAGWSGGYGYNVVLNHGGNVKSRSAHMSKMFVEVGDQVEQGEVIGKIGSTGRSTGPHIHFEIMYGSKKVNPLSYF